MTSKSARRIKSVPSGSSVEKASRAGPLEELFPRASRQGVLLDHWAEGRFLVEHGAPKSLEEAIAARFPTLRELAEFRPDLLVSVYGFLDTAKTAGTAAGTAGVQPLYTFPGKTVREAMPLYDAGYTVICWRIREYLPEAIERGSAILQALGLPHQPMAARGLVEPWSKASLFEVSLVYTPADCRSGLGVHYDMFDSIVVHLKGRKRWRVGRHQHLEYPVYNEESAARLDYPPAAPRLSTRTDLLGDLEDVDMRPGSVMLLPRGTYHTTQVDDEASLSIGYHFALPTWSDVVLAALERRLTSEPLMRTIPFGAFSLAGPTTPALERMAWATGRAREALADPRRLLEADLLDNLASHHQAAFRLASGGAVHLVADPPAIANYAGRGLDVKLPPAAGLLCHWMLGRKAVWFDFYDALAASGNQLAPRDVWNVLQEGVEAGLLQRRWGRSGRQD
jgi:Cupin superfamily protein